MTTGGGRLAWAALVAAAACWGSVIVFVKVAAPGLPVQTITLIETGLTVVVLAGVLAVRRTRLRRPPLMLLVAGLLEPGLTYPLINAGLVRTSGTHGAIIIGTESAVIVVLGAVLARRRPAPRIVLALVVTVSGAAVVGGNGGGQASVAGDALIAAGIVCAAGYVLLAQRVVGDVDAITLTFWQFLAGTALVLPVTAIAVSTSSSHSWWGQPSGGEVAAALAAGAVGSTGAFALYNWALSRVSTAAAGISLTLIPVFGIVFSIALLSESPATVTLLAALAVLCGVGIVALSGDGDPAQPNGGPHAPPPATVVDRAGTGAT